MPWAAAASVLAKAATKPAPRTPPPMTALVSAGIVRSAGAKRWSLIVSVTDGKSSASAGEAKPKRTPNVVKAETARNLCIVQSLSSRGHNQPAAAGTLSVYENALQ